MPQSVLWLVLQLAYTLFAGLLLVYLLFRVRRWYRWRKRGCIPLSGPPTLPFLGNLLQLRRARMQRGDVESRSTLPLFQQWTREYGHTYRFTLLGDRDIVLINDPASIRHVLSTHFRTGAYGKGAYQQEQYRDLIGQGIFNANPPQWQQQRKCAAKLFSKEALKQHAAVFHRHATHLCDALLELHSGAATDSPSAAAYSARGVDMQARFLRFTMGAFAEIGFGVELPANGRSDDNSVARGRTTHRPSQREFAEAFDFVQGRCFRRMDYGTLWPWLDAPDAQFQAHLRTVNAFVASCIEQAKSKPRAELMEKQMLRPDLLSQTLLEMTDDDGRPNSSYSESDLRDQVLNFLIAGRDTTALLLSWFFFLLDSHPHAEARIIEEMQQVLSSEESGAGEAGISFDSCKRMTYLNAALHETLRLYPPVPFNGFTALRDDILPGSFFVPKDTYVVYSAWLLHRRPELYDDPLRFDPERWLRGPAPRPFEFVAFHGGPRECLGREMALLEAAVCACAILQRCSLRMHPNAPLVELRRAITLSARKGVHMRVEPRKHTELAIGANISDRQ